MKVFVVGGAGVVGSATALYIAAEGITDELVISDLNLDMAKSHAKDMSQAAMLDSKTDIYAGTWEDAKDADVVVIGAGLPPRLMTPNTGENIKTMIPLMDSICEGVNKYCPNAVTLSLTNPLDIFNYVLYKRSGLKSNQFLGLAANDSIRFRYALGNHFGVHPSEVDAYMIGEHAGHIIPLYSSVMINGQPKIIEKAEQEEINTWQAAWWKEFIQISNGRTAGWTTGKYAAQTVKHILGKEDGPICASVILEENFATGYPVYLDKTGFVKTVELNMNADEIAEFEACKADMKAKIQDVMAYIV